MNNEFNALKEAKKLNQDNIGTLQGINVIYISIVFLLFILGITVLGFWGLVLGMFILPMFSVAYNFIATKIIKNEDVRISDIFIGRKVIFASFSQYYSIYKKSLLWSILGFFIVNLIGNYAYMYIIGIDKILSESGNDIVQAMEALMNDQNYLMFTIVAEIVGIICAYFVFTLTRQKYQFAPLILMNCPLKIEVAIKVSEEAYNNNKKIIKKGTLSFLIWWFISFVVAGLAFFLFNKYEIFIFDVALILSIFIFLFIGSFAISPKVLFKNIVYDKVLSSNINELKAKFLANMQE